MSDPELTKGVDDLPSEPIQLSPLSIQAASLVRSIEALSNIFWISIGGTFLSIFFAGLVGLQANATTDSISLGEYEVPKSLLPFASLMFAMFVFWLTANRLNMLAHVLHTTRLPQAMVHEIFHLNPPVLNIFDQDNTRRYAPMTGVAVFLINWSVYFGNAIALTLSSALQQGASFAEFDFPVLSMFVVLIPVVMIYGMRTCVPPLRRILNALHGVNFHVGWPRQMLAGVVTVSVILINIGDQFINPAEQSDDLIGPAFANAIDGETLFMHGVEVNLFGIDAVEPDQICQDAEGAPYQCGQRAMQALQEFVMYEKDVCFPLFGVNPKRVVATCELVSEDRKSSASLTDFRGEYDPDNLSRLMVVHGHALAIGLGETVFGSDQEQAQTLREGIWQGAFMPPASWRAQQQ